MCYNVLNMSSNQSDNKINNRKSNNKLAKKTRKPTIQKRSTIGAEVEFFILNKKGQAVNKADLILNRLKKENKKKDIVSEAGKNMIEAGCFPNTQGVSAMESLLENLETLLFAAEEETLAILPLGTYPGKMNPAIRKNGHYKYESELFGPNIYKLIAQCSGFHVHYSLPWGSFDCKKLKLKKLINSKHKQSLVNSYNFLTAADPALLTFAQSSPFYQGKYIAKDTRALLWRGDDELNFSPSLYKNFPEFGQLSGYKHTLTDLIDFIEKMNADWQEILSKHKLTKSELIAYPSVLNTNWTPLRINRHGTLEQRGMDINTPLVILAISRVVHNVIKAIQERFVKVEVSDIAIEHPFEYKNKTILIPPFTYVKTELQKAAIYKGLEDERVLKYCKRLLGLAKRLNGRKNEDIFEPLQTMIDQKKTTSDEIIDLAKAKGHKDLKKILPPDIANEISLHYSNKLFKEMVLFRELVKRL